MRFRFKYIFGKIGQKNFEIKVEEEIINDQLVTMRLTKKTVTNEHSIWTQSYPGSIYCSVFCLMSFKVGLFLSDSIENCSKEVLFRVIYSDYC